MAHKDKCCLEVETKTILTTWAEATISDGTNPSFIYQYNSDSIVVSTGSGNNGVGRIYTYCFPPHPNGSSYTVNFQVYDDTVGDTGLPEIISQTDTCVTYQIPQGDDGSSEDDNNYYQHHVVIGSAPCEVVTSITLI